MEQNKPDSARQDRKIHRLPRVIRPVATGRQRVLRIRASMPYSREWFMAAAPAASSPIPARPSIIVQRARVGSASSMPTQAVQEQQGRPHLWFGQLTIIVHPAEGEALYPPSPIHPGS